MEKPRHIIDRATGVNKAAWDYSRTLGWGVPENNLPNNAQVMGFEDGFNHAVSLIESRIADLHDNTDEITGQPIDHSARIEVLQQMIDEIESGAVS